MAQESWSTSWDPTMFTTPSTEKPVQKNNAYVGFSSSLKNKNFF